MVLPNLNQEIEELELVLIEKPLSNDEKIKILLEKIQKVIEEKQDK